MLLDVPSAVSKYRRSPSPAVSPSRRPHELPDVRRRRGSYEDGYDADRHYYVPSPYRSKPQAAAATTQSEPQSPKDTESSTAMKQSKQRLAAGMDRAASPRHVAKPNHSSSPPSHDSYMFPGHKRPNYRATMNDDYQRYCEAMIHATTKPILAHDRCHDCSMENVRSIVDGTEQRRGGGGRTRRSADDLLDVDSEDVAEAPSRRSVRFAPVVRVCDQTSTITFCQLRHHSASAPPVLGSGDGGGDDDDDDDGGLSCSLPSLSTGGCVGCRPHAVDSRAGGLDLPAVVERYMIRNERELQCVDDAKWTRPDDVHRFPPFRRRRI